MADANRRDTPLNPAIPPTFSPKLPGAQQDTQSQPHGIHFAPSPHWSPSASLLSVSTASSASEPGEGATMEMLQEQLVDIFRGLWRAFLISAAILGLTIFMIACIGAILGFFSAFGSLLVYAGNAVLRQAGHSGYTDDRSAAMVGAAGGVLSTLLFGLFSALLSQPTASRMSSLETPPVIVQLASSVVIGTLTGTIGSLILVYSGVDIGGLDVIHATRAGAVGGAIMTLAALIFIPVVLGMLVCLLPMTMLVVATWTQWLQERYEEDWNKFRHIRLPPDDVESATSGPLGDEPT